MVTKKLKRVLLLINGQKPKSLPNLDSYDLVICTDGAYHYFVEHNVQPDVVLGDFDSFDVLQVPEPIETIVREDQNYTDFWKALNYIVEKGFKEVDVYGANGNESDHYLGNLTVGSNFYNKINLTFFDDFGYSFFTDKAIELEDMKDRIVSLYPFPVLTEVHSKGLFFPLNGMDLDIRNRIGTRNHAIDDTIKISFQSGLLLLFISGYRIPLENKIYAQ